MGIYIFTKKEAPLKKYFTRNTQFISAIHSPNEGDISYIDVSGFSEAEFKKAFAAFKKCCSGKTWGIIDPKGSVKDTASCFFDGAHDYIGPSLLKEGKIIEAKRFKEVLLWRKLMVDAAITAALKGEDKSLKSEKVSGVPKTGIKLPAESAFPGWKKIPSGKFSHFYLLYCSLKGKVSLDSRLEGNMLALIHQRFTAYMKNNLQNADALFWMDSGQDCLFLLPPKVKSVEEAIKACLKMIVSAPLFVLETLNIKIPSNFVFALHYGSVNYKPPGKTGTIVSDAVNFVFHLGSKKAEAGRLTVSNEIPDKTIPQALQDCFLLAGNFEGRDVYHTRKFSYSKSWV